MTADMRLMLDELMGRDRNLSLVEKEKQMEHWSDESVSCSTKLRYLLFLNKTGI